MVEGEDHADGLSPCHRLFRVEQACAVIRDQTQRGGTFDLIPLPRRQTVQIVKAFLFLRPRRRGCCGKYKTGSTSSCQAVSRSMTVIGVQIGVDHQQRTFQPVSIQSLKAIQITSQHRGKFQHGHRAVRCELPVSDPGHDALFRGLHDILVPDTFRVHVCIPLRLDGHDGYRHSCCKKAYRDDRRS